MFAKGDARRDSELLAGITKAGRKVVRLANDRSLESLALPLIGTGTIGLQPSVVIDLLVHALRDELAKGSTLRNVVIVARNESVKAKIETALNSEVQDREEVEHFSELAKNIGAAAGLLSATSVGTAIGAAAGSAMGTAAIPAAAVFGWQMWTKLKAKNKRSKSDTRQPDRVELGAKGLAAQLRLLTEENDRLREENRRLRLSGSLSLLDDAPMPAAFAAAMVEGEKEEIAKAGALKKAVPILVRYLAALMLADYEASGGGRKGTNTRIQSALKEEHGDGRWVQLIESIVEAHGAGARSFFDDAASIWMGKRGKAPLLGKLRALVSLRNDDTHLLMPPSRDQSIEWLSKAEPRWKEALELAQPIFRHRMFSVESIVDLDSEAQVYLVRWLTGSRMLPRAETVRWKARLGRSQVFLQHPEREEFLPLHPFLEYRYCDITTAPEPWGIDIVRDEVRFSTFRFPTKSTWPVDTPRCLRVT